MKKTKSQQLGITEFPYTEHDNNDMLTYLETSIGVWSGFKRNKQGVRTYWENFKGVREYYIR